MKEARSEEAVLQSGPKLERTIDPLLIDVPLTHQQTVFPYGFPVVVQTNCQAITRMAAEAWAHWKRQFDFPPIEVRYFLNEQAPGRKTLPEPVLRAQKNLMTLTGDNENFASCDLSTGFGYGWFTEAALAQKDYFRFYFLEGMILSLLDNMRVLSIHAACVSREGKGVLLAGDSGAGKSSLSYACALRGWTFVSDDASVLVWHSRDRVVLGESGRFRFRESASDIFPEFRGLTVNSKRPGNGKPTIEVRTASLRGIQTAQRSVVESIVFLRRHGNAVAPALLIPFQNRREAMARLVHHSWPDDIPSYGQRLEALERLLDATMYEMEYCDLDGAVNALHSLVGGAK